MQAAHRVMAAGMRNEFVGETAARAGGRPRGCFCPQCGQVNHKMGEWWCCGEGSGRSTGRLVGWMAVTWLIGWLVVSWLVGFFVGDWIDVLPPSAARVQQAWLSAEALPEVAGSPFWRPHLHLHSTLHLPQVQPPLSSSSPLLPAGNNNLIACWSCTSRFCYCCRTVLRGRGAGGTHFGPRGCKQHSPD
jgi:hypothetical protein